MSADTSLPPMLGVVIVTYAAADFIATCLETLLGARDVALRVVIIDNGSPDDTITTIESWAGGAATALGPLPFEAPPVPKPIPLDGTIVGNHAVTLVATGANLGFAGGVNRGLALLAEDTGIDRYWVLNPDCAVPPDTPAKFAGAPDRFSLMGGRIAFLDDPDKIQIDGGTIRWATGLTKNLNYLSDPLNTPPPKAETLDFISGASMVVSRAHLEDAGPMQEDYFLYYEEVDWAQRRNAPLAYVDGALVYHKGGASIGSRTTKRKASAVSVYFIHRARLRFLWRFWKIGLLGGGFYSLAKAAQMVIEGDASGAAALLRGSVQARAPRQVRQKIGLD